MQGIKRSDNKPLEQCVVRIGGCEAMCSATSNNIVFFAESVKRPNAVSKMTAQ